MSTTPQDDPFRPRGLHGRLGFEVIELGIGLAVLEVEIGPHHLNRAGIVHGGTLLALMDEASGACGMMTDLPGILRPGVTVSLSGQFTGQARAGVLRCRAEIVSHGRTIYHARAEVRDAGGVLLSFSASVHRWHSGTVTLADWQRGAGAGD